MIAERGLERTRYIDVARESGNPVSTLQNAFGSLQAMLEAAIAHVSDRDGAILRSLPDASSASAAERIEALVVGSVVGEGAFENWLVWLELWRAAARDTGLADHCAVAYEQWWSATEAIIADGQSTGEFTTEVPARDLAIAVVAAIDGSVVALLLRAEDSSPQHAADVALMTVRRTLTP